MLLLKNEQQQQQQNPHAANFTVTWDGSVLLFLDALEVRNL